VSVQIFAQMIDKVIGHDFQGIFTRIDGIGETRRL
jgi:hypothetical protein